MFFIRRPFLFRTLICYRPAFPTINELRVLLTLAVRFNRGKDNRKSLIGTSKTKPPLFNRGGRLIRVIFAVFY